MTKNHRTGIARSRTAQVVGLAIGLGLGLLATVVAPAADAAPAANFTATPLQAAVCVAPCAVHFDSAGTDDPQYTREFHTMLYRWNFGDVASAAKSWWHTAETGISRNQDFGPIVGHVYETPGTYTATLEVTAPDLERGTVTRSVTVADPNTVFAANTWCFSTGSNFAGCPNDRNGDGDCIDSGDVNQCVTLGANQFDEALTNGATGSPRGCNADQEKSRCLFKGGDTFSSDAQAVLFRSSTAGLISSFGTGRAIVNANTPFLFGIRDGWQIANLVVHFTGGTASISAREWSVPLGGSIATNNAGYFNLTLDGPIEECSGMGNGTGTLNTKLWFVDFVCTRTANTAAPSFQLLATTKQSLWLGVYVFPGYRPFSSSNARIYLQDTAFAHNWLKAPGPDASGGYGAPLQLRASSEFGVPLPSTRNVVSYNHIQTKNGPAGAGAEWTKICNHPSGCLGPATEEPNRGAACADIVYENNFHDIEDGVADRGLAIGVAVRCSDTTVRNNVFDYQGQGPLATAPIQFVLFSSASTEVLTGNVQIYNNTSYLTSESGDYTECYNGSGVTAGNRCTQNLAYSPGGGAMTAIATFPGTYPWATTTPANDLRTGPIPNWWPRTPPVPPAGAIDFLDYVGTSATCDITGATQPGAQRGCIVAQAGSGGSVCGNGQLQAGEACDDGNTVSGDGCSATCTIEVAVCGNGVRQGTETCDDGNTISWDGCSATCAVEIPVCGNGHRQGTEACDDGNTISWDGCSATCAVEIPVCGNGHLQGTEACDDGNTVSGDGCSATCTLEVAVCGDGVVQIGEGCDDNNVVGGDGCSASCLVESNPDAPLEYLINAGGPGFTAASGKVWSSDASFANGGRVAFDSVAIGLTGNDQLYQSRRYGQAGGPPLVLEFPMAGIGPYRVRLHFAELDPAVSQAGLRVFNVIAENVVSIPDVDIFASIGFARAHSRVIYVNVDDGALTLSFESVVGEPMIAAVEIIEQAPQTDAPEFVDPCVEFPEDCQ